MLVFRCLFRFGDTLLFVWLRRLLGQLLLFNLLVRVLFLYSGPLTAAPTAIFTFTLTFLLWYILLDSRLLFFPIIILFDLLDYSLCLVLIVSILNLDLLLFHLYSLSFNKVFKLAYVGLHAPGFEIIFHSLISTNNFFFDMFEDRFNGLLLLAYLPCLKYTLSNIKEASLVFLMSLHLEKVGQWEDET